MKFPSKKQEPGSALVITLITCGVIATVLASYLVLLSTRYNLTARSMAWNATMPVLEAGLEEAMTHLKCDTNSPSANGWYPGTYAGQVVNMKTRTFADGSYALVRIANAGSSSPTIYSSGFVPAPLGHGYISRTVRVTTQSQGVFGAAILSKNSINLGSDFLIDSYDDTKGPYSTNNAGANAGIASISTSPGMLMLADSKIYGQMSTPPTGGYTIGTHGKVGDTAFVNNVANDGKVQAGYYHNDLNITIDDVVPPSGYASWLPPTYLGDSKKGPKSYTYNGVTYTNSGGGWSYVLLPGNYNMGSTTLAGSVLVLGAVTLYVPSNGRIQFGSGNVLSIPASANSSFKLYNASTTDAVMKDASNDSLNPSKFMYYGLPTTAGTKLDLTGSGAFAFCGIIYAPQQNIRITGSSSGNEDFLGAVTCNDFSMSGHTYMHYPESLKGGPSGGIVVASWKEL